MLTYRVCTAACQMASQLCGENVLAGRCESILVFCSLRGQRELDAVAELSVVDAVGDRLSLDCDRLSVMSFLG